MNHKIFIDYICPICGHTEQAPLLNQSYQNYLCFKCSVLDNDGEYYEVYSEPVKVVQVITSEFKDSDPIKFIPSKILFPSYNNVFDINENCDICNKCETCEKFSSVDNVTECQLKYNEYCIKTSDCCQSVNHNKLLFLQRNHFSYEEIWNLDATISSFIIPRLKAFIDSIHSYPGSLTFDDWKIKLRYMLVFFKLKASDNDSFLYTKNNIALMKKQAYKKGKYYFYKYFEHLWD